ncbi:type II toxin-antitoxin system VapC family toxin [Achromobacter xylosoxidans]|uniref:type II toxin-antitoxin system VapC family toxin n=1 Tax=Alcaligenes xylosoxydans xylosoxydans TaxID=85698 RepID=UPI000B48FD21|nr:type II toxin-antitoxin system VapC family toxin [Achromobacter xylosoxidans]
MSGYLLDTNIISALLRDPGGRAARHVARVGHRKICTSIIVSAELRYGCAEKGSAKLLAKVESLLAVIPVLPFDVAADAKYGGIRADLEAAGQTIGANDLLIGAHAHALGLTLVTGNMREFERIRGLAMENWLI